MDKTPDKLTEMFKIQEKLQISLGNTMLYGNQEYINVMTIATIDEIMEGIRETKWKPWKKQQKFNPNRYKEELIDEFHFFINRCLAADMTAEELYARFLRKNHVNHVRQKEGY